MEHVICFEHSECVIPTLCSDTRTSLEFRAGYFSWGAVSLCHPCSHFILWEANARCLTPWLISSTLSAHLFQWDDRLTTQQKQLSCFSLCGRDSRRLTSKLIDYTMSVYDSISRLYPRQFDNGTVWILVISVSRCHLSDMICARYLSSLCLPSSIVVYIHRRLTWSVTFCIHVARRF